MNIKLNNRLFGICASWQANAEHIPKKARFHYILKARELNLEYLGIYSDKKLSGYFCLPAYLSDIINDLSFVFVHKINKNDYYYCIFRDGAIEPQTDRIMKAYDVQESINSFINRNEGIKVYFNSMDKGFQDELINTEFVELYKHDLVKPNRSHRILDGNKSKESLRNILMVVFVLGVIAALFFMFKDDLFKSSHKTIRKVVMVEPSEKEIQDEVDKLLKIKLATFYKLPNIEDVIKSCQVNFNAIPDGFSYWSNVTKSCSNTKLSKSYKRSSFGAYTSDFRTAFEKYGKVNITLVFPPIGKVTNKHNEFTNRNVVVDDIKLLDTVNIGIFDSLLRTNDSFKVSSHTEPVKVNLGEIVINKYPVDISKHTSFSIGSFTITDIGFNDIFKVLGYFEQEHIFFNKLKNKGENYEIQIDYITK